MKSLIVFLFISVNISISFAQNASGGSFNITHENDFLAIANNDENYTGGLKAEYLTPHLNYKCLPFYAFSDPDALNIQKISFGGVGYTPQNLDETKIITTERPYGSFTSGGFGRISFNSTRSVSVQSELLLGAIGAKGPGQVQRYLHRKHVGGRNRAVPQGWPNQIGHAGVFGFNYNVLITINSYHSNRKKAKQLQREFEKNKERLADSLVYTKARLEAIANSDGHIDDIANELSAVETYECLQTRWIFGTNLGTFMDYILIGYQLDLFNFNRNSLYNYNPNVIKLYKDADIYLDENSNGREECLKFNIFLRPMLKFVGYNASLQGLLNREALYEIKNVDINRTLFEFEAGINITLVRRINIIYTFAGRSNEYKGGKDFHYWGGITLAFFPVIWNPVKKTI